MTCSRLSSPAAPATSASGTRATHLPVGPSFSNTERSICARNRSCRRLFHRSCHNYSDRLRHALFYDVAKKSVNRYAYRELRSFQPQHYQPARMEQSLLAMEAEPGGAEEEEYYASEEPTGLWADWSEEVRSCPEEFGEPALAAAAQRAAKL